MKFLPVIKIESLVRLYPEQASLVLLDCNVLTLESLFFLGEITSDVGRQLLDHGVE